MDGPRSAPDPIARAGGIGYRPAIDGLRAVAVLAVVAYHALPAAVPGGFVGVDVFFVISGYLITALLLGEHARNGRLDWKAFYARRIRRLLPALLLVLAAVLAGAALFLAPRGVPLPPIAESAGWALGFVANLHFLAQTGDYFGGDLAQAPLLHTWSLAVEEQYYLTYPLLLSFLLGRGRRALFAGLAVLAVVSLLYAEHALRIEPARAFYLMPARFWELAAGAFIAMRPPAEALRRHGAWLLPAGLAAIVGTCVLGTPAGHFPGVGALPAVAGAAAVILAVHAGGDGGFAGRLLASRPAVAIGLLSYGWYLWHWPLLAMDAAFRLEPASPLHRVLLCLVALAAAAASLRWVERPVRAFRWAPRQWLLGAALAATMLVGAGYWTAGLQRMPPEVAEMARRARYDVPEHMKRCHFTLRSDVRALMPPRCDSAPGQPPRLAVWGDSHAEAWQPAAWEIARARGVAATAMTMGSCTPMIGSAGRRSDIAGFAANCARLNELALARLREGGIDLLMIASRWPAPYPGRDGVVPDAAARTAGRLTPAELEASLDRVLSELRAVPRILLMLPIPELRHDAARCIAMGRTAECAYSRAEFDRAAAASTAMLRRLAATHANVVLVDPSSWFCDATACRVTRDGASLYFDDDHVSATASAAFGRAYAADPARFEPGAATPGADGGRGTIRP